MVFGFKFYREFEEQLRSQEEMGLFSKIPIFVDFPAHVVQIFLRNSNFQSFSRNSLIYKIGDFTESLFFIKEGQIEVNFYDFS
jgi:hypothetical protein